METYIPLVISIISIILSIINLIFLIVKYKQYMIHSEKILVKRRLFRDWFQQTKGLTDRMEFMEIKDHGNYTTYSFQIKDKNSSGYLNRSQDKILIERIGKIGINLFGICGYKVEERDEDLAEHIRSLSIKKYLHEDCISVPNDMLPNNSEELKVEILNNIIITAKENGIKEKYLK